MRTAIYLSAMIIAYAIDPTWFTRLRESLDVWPFFIIFIGLVLFSMDLIIFGKNNHE